MEYVKILLDNLTKMYNISYRILNSNEDKDYSVNSPYLYAYFSEDINIIFDLSAASVSKNIFDKFIKYLTKSIHDILNQYKNSPTVILNTHDALTGVYNRMYFEDMLKKQKDAVIIAGDVNNLKVMNDVFGHHMGDQLLIIAAELMKKHAKEHYIIARCGGDEFNVIIPNGSIKEAKEYCNKIQQECKNYSDVQLLLKPQISLGYVKQQNDESIEDTLKRADDFMYINKTKIKEETNVIEELENKLYELDYANKEEMKYKLQIALSFGLYLNLPLITLADLALAIKIEEIGMLAVPKEIKFKEEPLTKEEIEIIKRHPETGFRLAKLDNNTLKIATTIYQCHEHYDGTGYPCGIKKESIDYLARLILLVTGYTKAYTNNISLGDDKAYELAIKDISEKTIYDPVLRKQFIEYMKNSRDIIQEKGEYDI